MEDQHDDDRVVTRMRPGEHFAGYIVERRLGSGGMGEVYLARHPRLARRDALKLLAGSVARDPAFRLRFTREADAVATLDHPNIVTVYDRGETDGRLWIAFAFVDGVDLSRHLADPLPVRNVVDALSQIADALDAAAQRGLVHRDVKPANIIRRPDGHAMLTDFGIAQSIHAPGDLTGVGQAVGTVAYASPEQLQGLPVDARSDQYSLACTAFALLVGRPPFTGPTSGAVIVAHARDEVPSASGLRPDRVPAAADAVFTRALAKNPADRYPDSRTFAADMERAAAGLTGESKSRLDQFTGTSKGAVVAMKASSSCTVTELGLEKLDSDTAVVLATLTTVTKRADAVDQVARLRMRYLLTEADGDWLISQIQAV